MRPNAAMETKAPKAPRPFFYAGAFRNPTVHPTSIMVHIEGHGPRRIYSGPRGFFYWLNRRRVRIDINEALRLVRDNR